MSPVSATSLAGLLLFLALLSLPHVASVEGAEGTTSATVPSESEVPPSTEQTATVPPSATAPATVSATATNSPTPASTEPPTPYALQSVLINELAWSGTLASANDEWIELRNPGASSIDLKGWRLSDGADINVALTGTIPAGGYFLLERTDDSSVDNIAADQIYTGSLLNSGEQLELTDRSGNVVDSANSEGGGWPAGESATRRSMERRGGSDIAENWGTFTGIGGTGRDAAGNPIAGTPRNLNSVLIPTATPTLRAPPSPTAHETLTLEPSRTLTPSATLTPSQTADPIVSATASSSPTVPPTEPPAPYAPQSVLINEIAWSGTVASSSDEWIELHNPGAGDISLDGWTLTDGTDIAVSLAGRLPAHGYYLMERTDDTTVSDVAADRIYTGSLRDDGEILQLLGPSHELVDSANSTGGGWPAGGSSPKASMERRGEADRSRNWGSFTGYNGNGVDASGNPIQGTPRRTNSLFFPTPTPTAIPSQIVINEVLIRPRPDWEGTGGVTTADEFIELYNAGSLPVHLKGWRLDDIASAGSSPYDLPGLTISSRGTLVFFRSRSKIALNDTGDTVRLLAPGGQIIDQISYLGSRAGYLSYGRLPDGSSNLRYGLWPTPGEPNLLFEEPVVAARVGTFFPLECAGSLLTMLERASRHPAQVAWLRGMYLVGCESGPEIGEA